MKVFCITVLKTVESHRGRGKAKISFPRGATSFPGTVCYRKID